jgi:hypothetical protein
MHAQIALTAIRNKILICQTFRSIPLQWQCTKPGSSQLALTETPGTPMFLSLIGVNEFYPQSTKDLCSNSYTMNDTFTGFLLANHSY